MNFKNLTHMLVGAITVAMLCIAPFANADSKRATGTTLASIVVEPSEAGTVTEVTSVDATSDLATSSILFKARAVSTDSHKVSAISLAGQSVISLVSTAGIAVSDVVVVSVSATPSPQDAASYKRTVTAVSTTGITVNSSIPVTLTKDAVVTEVTTVYSIPVGAASISRTASNIVRTAGGSPILIELSGTAACSLSTTTK